ncbi:MAG: hypothetical protein HY645_02935 [Acidobacteria bacterium]|nr:hypothetical protein [Acidobacteriota bacterium]
MRLQTLWIGLGVISVLGLDLAAEISARNFLWINSEVCTAGQPSLQDLVELKGKGLRSVLSLRLLTKAPIVVEEEERAKQLGLKYFNVPVDVSRLDESSVDRFLEIVADRSNRPILIHCASAGRVGAFWIVHRVLRDGWSFEKAEEEARRIGLNNRVLLEFARGYLRKRGLAP